MASSVTRVYIAFAVLNFCAVTASEDDLFAKWSCSDTKRTLRTHVGLHKEKLQNAVMVHRR